MVEIEGMLGRRGACDGGENVGGGVGGRRARKHSVGGGLVAWRCGQSGGRCTITEVGTGRTGGKKLGIELVVDDGKELLDGAVEE